MTTQLLKTPVCSLLMLSVFFTSCNGQTTTKQTNQTVVKQQSFTSRYPKLTKTQGTSIHQNVHCSLQDKNGNIWFGTTGEGVYQFDGNVFTQFTVKDGLSNNSVWSMLEDKSGVIWFGTDDGLSQYDGKTISKVSFAATNLTGLGAATTYSGKNAVWSIMQDKDGVIWFGTSADLYCYDGKTFRRFLDNDTIANEQKLQLKWIQCLLQDRNGTIWMGSGPIALEGVIRFNGKSITGTKPTGDGWIRYMLEDKNGTIWFSGRLNGVFRYDSETFKSFTENNVAGSPVLVDKSGTVWFDGGEKQNAVESMQGIWNYDGKAFKNFTAKDGMGKYSVWSMLEDRSGHIWIGTRNCGLYRYDGKTFVSFSE